MSEPVSFEEFTAKYDLREQEERHREQQRRHDRAVRRWKSGATATGFASASAAVVGIGYVIYLGTAGPSAEQRITHEEKTQCTSEGGTWIKVADGDQSTGYGTCLFGRD